MTIFAMSRERTVSVKSPKHTSFSARSTASTLIAVRNPSEPMLIGTTGGIARGKNLDAHKIVPSPPKTTTKSVTSSRLNDSSSVSQVKQSCALANSASSPQTGGSSHVRTPLAFKVATALLSASVAAASLIFFTKNAFFGASSHENLTCGNPFCLMRILRSKGSITCALSSFTSASSNAAFERRRVDSLALAPSMLGS